MSLDIPKIKDEVWTTKDGIEIEVKNMSESHVKNVLRLLIRRINNVGASVITDSSIVDDIDDLELWDSMAMGLDDDWGNRQ